MGKHCQVLVSSYPPHQPSAIYHMGSSLLGPVWPDYPIERAHINRGVRGLNMVHDGTQRPRLFNHRSPKADVAFRSKETHLLG